MTQPTEPNVNPSANVSREGGDVGGTRAALAASSHARPVLSVLAPTYNEKDNIRRFVAALQAALDGVDWELIFIDDDSPDGTWAEVSAVAAEFAFVRCIRRVGRRGLASAVVEGALSASAEIVAVIDADMQHDEKLLPRMLRVMLDTDTDVVIGSRHVEGGGLGNWDQSRQRMSSFATWTARLLIGSSVSDPMSGFFMTRRSVFDASIYDLSQQGYKILLDILTSSPRELKIAELPYVFRGREAGESKIDSLIILEYAFLLIEKLTKGLIPPRFVLFCLVGGLGLAVHLTVLGLVQNAGVAFLSAQTIATVCAMTFNFVVNNSVTYRSARLTGINIVTGWLIFCLVCSIGAIANISVAAVVMNQFKYWWLAGVAGALMSSVFNFGVATRFVWERRRRSKARIVRAARAG